MPKVAGHAIPEDLAAELAVVEAVAKARRAERDAWRLARELVDERRLTIERVATIAGISTRTAARRLGRSRAAAGGHV